MTEIVEVAFVTRWNEDDREWNDYVQLTFDSPDYEDLVVIELDQSGADLLMHKLGRRQTFVEGY